MPDEKVIHFGQQNSLLGIIGEPGEIDAKRPAVLVLNAGLIHRVGPYRMGVDLSRALSRRGYLVCRFDLSNIGDSVNYPSVESHHERTLHDLGAAMDAIEKRYGISEFVSVGLCTGAMNSHLAARDDPRVKAAVMLDGYIYPTRRFYFNRLIDFCSSLFDSEKLAKRVAALFDRGERQSDLGVTEGIYYWEMPVQDEIRRDLEAMVARGVHLLFIYSGGMYYYVNYERQFRDCFAGTDFRDLLEVRYFGKMDHTYTLTLDRERMLACLVAWLDQRYGTTPTAKDTTSIEPIVR